MLKEIIRKEMLEHLLGLRFAIACFLCLTVILTSLFVRGLDYTQNLDDYHQNMVMDRQELEAAREPWHLLWSNVRLNLRPNSMKIFVQGINQENGGTVSLRGQMPALVVPQDIANTSVPLFPLVDMVFFVGVILSLMAVVFGYNAISGEKENGTLRLLLSYSVPRDQVLLGKWLGGYLTLIIPFVITSLGMAAVLMIQRNIDLDAGQWLRFTVFLLLSLLFLAAIYSLALWISTITHRSSTSIIILAALWVVFVMAVPNLSPYAAMFLRGNRGAVDVNKVRADLYGDIWEGKLAEQKKAYDRDNNLAPGWDADRFDPVVRKKKPERYKTFAMMEKEAHMTLLREYDKLETQVGNELDGEIRLGKWISRLSPFSCLSMAAMELAGEGIDEQRRRMKQVGEYQKQFFSYVYDEIGRRNDYFASIVHLKKKGDPWPGMRKPIPKFQYQPAVMGAYMKPIILDAAMLAVFTLVFFMLSFTAFLRYDVR